MKLYKKSSTGKTLVWEINTIDDGYYTISGQLEGKLITSAITKCTGKNIGKINETSPVNQAIAEALAIHTKKLREGYVDSIEKLEEELEFFPPMLAHDYHKNLKRVEFPLFSQPKLDGIRCIGDINSLNSRTGKPIVSIKHVLEEINDTLPSAYRHLKIDGELYCHEETFEDIVSLVRKLKPEEEDFKLSRDSIKFYVYDLFDKNNPEFLFETRYHLLLEFFTKCEFIEVLKTDFCKTQEELDAKYIEYIDDGFEGQMIRLNTPYETKRSRNLLKRKDFITEEFTVVDILSGKGKFENIASKAIIEVNGVKVDPPINGSFPFLKEVLENKESYIGKSATVKFFEYTTDGSLRFPKVVGFNREEYE